MRFWLLGVVAVLSGCAGDRSPDREPDRRKAGTADYRATAEALLDSIAALADRYRPLQGLVLPANSRPEGVRYALHHAFDESGPEGLTLDVTITLHDDPAGAFRVGDLRVAIVAGGARGAAVHEAIFSAIDPVLRTFNREFLQ